MSPTMSTAEMAATLGVSPDEAQQLRDVVGGSMMMSPELTKRSPGVLLTAGSFSCRGLADGKVNQDRGLVCYPFGDRALVVVADGHGANGGVVSDFVVKHLVVELSRDDDVRRCFMRVNDKLTTDLHADASTSGTTCVVALLRPESALIAHVGDSRAVVGRRRPGSDVYNAHDLTRDHKPDDPIEKARLQRCGAFVNKPDWSATHRVWLDQACTWPGLAMARSIGDLCVKPVGVTADPDVANYDFHRDDAFLVLATDGVWEFMSSDDVVRIVGLILHNPKNKNKPNLAQICAADLIKCAMKQWKKHEDSYRDDITATVILLPWLPPSAAALQPQPSTAAVGAAAAPAPS